MIKNGGFHEITSIQPLIIGLNGGFHEITSIQTLITDLNGVLEIMSIQPLNI